MTPSRDTVICRRSDVRFRRVKDEWVVIRQQAAEVLVLNEWAGRMLELLDGSRTLGQIVDTLAEEYDAAPDIMESDVVSFASELLEAGLSEQVGSASP